MTTSCTIVVPCYNEARRLDTGAFSRFVSGNGGVRFLFVDDGSNDGTASVLRGLCEEDEDHFALVQLGKNMGKAEAVRRGILRALEDGAGFVGYWDADLATPLEEILEFRRILEARPRVQVVLGSRVKLLGRRIERRPWRHYVGRVFATFASLSLRLPVYDTQCGAKLFRTTPAVRTVFEQPFRTTWVFDVEVLARLRCVIPGGAGAEFEEVACEYPLSCWCDVLGSKVRPWHALGAVRDLAAIRRLYRGGHGKWP